MTEVIAGTGDYTGQCVEQFYDGNRSMLTQQGHTCYVDVHDSFKDVCRTAESWENCGGRVGAVECGETNEEHLKASKRHHSPRAIHPLPMSVSEGQSLREHYGGDEKQRVYYEKNHPRGWTGGCLILVVDVVRSFSAWFIHTTSEQLVVALVRGYAKANEEGLDEGVKRTGLLLRGREFLGLEEENGRHHRLYLFHSDHKKLLVSHS
ncbi:hypothetical protein DFJ58DRAFT_841839 [Suillus subalutaceus]|uniref:uncharacterized protein n=1 Tax=Suillus subalutaceus TaxID=48586 RepID=UPI001B86E8C3|nr:uncharacterized protein DFJ58DRAFT_841839 [Suillus subalutaceus]KAG1852812.1 hypothetical protein DFJ58DRAFT_841839 [Suillus subalutaceus]